MQTKELSSKEYFKSLKIIHFALLAGQIMFAGVTIFLHFSEEAQPKTDESMTIFFLIAPLLVAVGLIVRSIFSKAQLEKLKRKETLKEKFGAYQIVFIVRLALLEGPALFAIICFLLTGNLIFIGLAFVVMAFFISTWPNRDKIVAELELNQKEIDSIEDPTTIVAEVRVR